MDRTGPQLLVLLLLLLFDAAPCNGCEEDIEGSEEDR